MKISLEFGDRERMFGKCILFLLMISNSDQMACMSCLLLDFFLLKSLDVFTVKSIFVFVFLAHKIIDERIREIRETKEEGEHVGFITHFLREDSMSLKDVYANISELMGAAVDTVSG